MISADELKKLDDKAFIERFIKVSPATGGQPIPFILNAPQQFFWAEWDKAEAAGPAVLVVVKGRQVGITQLSQARGFTRCFRTPGYRMLSIAHNIETAEEVARRFEDCYLSLPSAFREANSARQSSKPPAWAFSNRSTSDYHTSRTYDAKRGANRQLIHLSEFGYYPEPARILKAVSPAAARAGDRCTVIIESTVSELGRDSYYYELYLRAEAAENRRLEGLPTTDLLRLVFIPWWVEPSNSVKGTKLESELIPLRPDSAHEEEEVRLRRLNPKLTDYQLAWRRVQVDTFLGVDGFRREHPSTPDEAFDQAGESCFDIKDLDWLAEDLRNSPSMVGDLFYTPNGIEILANKGGRYCVRRRPQDFPDQREYLPIIFVDPTVGTKDGSYCAASVLCEFGGVLEEVANYHARVPGREAAQDIVKLARYYGSPLLAWEGNGEAGQAFAAGVAEAGYTNIFRQPRAQTGRLENPYGLITNRAIQETAVALFADRLSTHEIRIGGERTLSELRRFGRLSSGKFGAVRGHDDLAWALILGVYVWFTYPKRPVRIAEIQLRSPTQTRRLPMRVRSLARHHI